MAKGAPRFTKRTVLFAVIAACVVVAVGAFFFAQSRFNVLPNLVAVNNLPPATQQFPVIDTASTTETQKAILTLLKQEYEAQPDGTKYAQGIEEAWCADFASWIMNEADVPWTNPHSGSWRIPGTYTLREYFQSEGRFESIDSGYQPKLGDIILYDNPSAFGQHTNVVIKNEDGIITTVGGNEGGKIRIQTKKVTDDPGLVGYGRLE